MKKETKDMLGGIIFLIGIGIAIFGFFTNYPLLVSGYGFAIAFMGGLIMDRRKIK